MYCTIWYFKQNIHSKQNLNTYSTIAAQLTNKKAFMVNVEKAKKTKCIIYNLTMIIFDFFCSNLIVSKTNKS